MLLVLSTTGIIFSTTVLLVVLQPSNQLTYPCNSSAICGCSSNPASVSRIVGGESAGRDTWGWAVSLSITMGTDTGLCGGAILSNFWIITAAHCVIDVTASEITVYAGSNTQLDGQSRVAARIFIHPNYISSTKMNDIALIQLSTPLTITSAVKTICIPSVDSSTLVAGEWPLADLSVVAVGWGALWEDGWSSLSLQQVTLQTIAYNAAMCSSVLYNRQVQFCAGVPGGRKDTCQGDSGGPLMMYTASQQWMLVGLTSYGRGCARPYYAGVYTRVVAYQNWIATITDNAYNNPISSEPANTNLTTTTFLSTTTTKRTTSLSTTRKPDSSSAMREIALVPHVLSLFLASIFISFHSL